MGRAIAAPEPVLRELPGPELPELVLQGLVQRVPEPGPQQRGLVLQVPEPVPQPRPEWQRLRAQRRPRQLAAASGRPRGCADR